MSLGGYQAVGKAARERKLKKEPERQRRERQSAGQPGSNPGATDGFGDGADVPDRSSPRERAAEAVGEAVEALCADRQAQYDSRLAQLASTEQQGWTGTVSRCIAEALRASVSHAWRGGWQPAELTRHVERELSQLHALMLADMISSEMLGYAAATVDPRWTAQVSGLAVTLESWGSDADYLAAWQARAGGRTSLGGRLGTVATAIEVLHQLRHLHALERLLPLPGTTASRAASRPAASSTEGKAADERVLSRIRALLAKAESTEFAEEAEALSGRAQELMAKYSIDHALLAAAKGTKETPGGRRIPVDNPYESPKVQLLNEVAHANRCRTVWLKELGMVTVIGFEADLDAVELLFTSLLVQANTALLRGGAKQSSRSKAFRQSFFVAYAYRIGERLTEAADHAVREATDEQAAQRREHPGDRAPGTDLVPLLAAREQAVDDAVGEMFGNRLTTSRAVRATDLAGWNSGRAAADLAALHHRDQVTD